jgi:lipoprotein signal peptidase
MFFILLFGVLIIDQITKYIVYLFLQPQGVIPVINKVFYLSYLENRGAALGILQNTVGLLIGLTLVIILCGSYYIYKNPKMNNVTKYSIAMIIGGAAGNLIDRIRLGYVIEFFDFFIWPVFNVADMSVVAGSIVLVYIMLFDKNKVVN